jgi:hypothetical protein
MRSGGQVVACNDEWLVDEELGLILPAGYVAPESREPIMTEAPKTEPMPEQDSRPLTPLEIFFVKLGGITTAAIVFLVCSTLFLQSLIESRIDQMPMLKGGHAFWEDLERKVDAFANGDDIAPEKKARIIASIKKIADRYRPYFDAAAGSSPRN